MLSARIATAGILSPILVAGILVLPPAAMAAVFAAFLAVGAWEWARLAGWETNLLRFGYVALTGTLAAALYHFADTPRVVYFVTAAACVWWCVALAWVIVYETGGPSPPRHAAATGSVGCLVLLPAWTAVVALLMHEAAMLLALFALIWSADSIAYFAGRRWGRHRLAARISPGKTWEGLCGALASTVPVAVLIALVLGLSGKSSIVFGAVSVVAVMLSVVGDLVESIYKRRQSLKDSGTILPGHGGVLDRIDSLTAAAPVFVFGLNWL